MGVPLNCSRLKTFLRAETSLLFYFCRELDLHCVKFGNVILKILSVRLYKLEFIYHNCHLLQCLTGLHENTPRIFMLSLSTAYNSSTA